MPEPLTQLLLLFMKGLQGQGMGLSPNQTIPGLQGKLLACGWQVKEVCRNCIWDEGRVMEQGEHGGTMGLVQGEQRDEEGGMGLISNRKDCIFCCICVVTDPDFGNTAPWDAANMPAWSLSESALCPGDLWAEAVVGEPSTGEGGPLCSSPYTVPGHTLFKRHRDGGHRSPRRHGESSAQLVLGKGWFWVPSWQRRTILPPQ